MSSCVRCGTVLDEQRREITETGAPWHPHDDGRCRGWREGLIRQTTGGGR